DGAIADIGIFTQQASGGGMVSGRLTGGYLDPMTVSARLDSGALAMLGQPLTGAVVTADATIDGGAVSGNFAAAGTFAGETLRATSSYALTADGAMALNDLDVVI